MTGDSRRSPLMIPIEVGDRVSYSLGYATAMWPIGKIDGDIIAGGELAGARGEVVAIEDTVCRLATVHWNDGRDERISAANLIREHLRGLDADRYRRESRWSLSGQYCS